VGFEPTIPVLKPFKSFHTLKRAATVIGIYDSTALSNTAILSVRCSKNRGGALKLKVKWDHKKENLVSHIRWLTSYRLAFFFFLVSLTLFQ
jgi:hypothetical protein